jgi:hypothetical protein
LEAVNLLGLNLVVPKECGQGYLDFLIIAKQKSLANSKKGYSKFKKYGHYHYYFLAGKGVIY